MSSVLVYGVFEDGVDCIQYAIVGEVFNAKCCDTYMHVGFCLCCHWKEHYLGLKSTEQNNMLCPYLHVNSVVEVPPGDHDVLHATGIHPHRILMQASVKIAAAGLCLKGKKGNVS